jgi:nucleotide-binding universal stress UspA family protein
MIHSSDLPRPFRRVLVPLDGSPIAETALAVVASLVELLDSSVLLLHVIERDAPVAVHGERHLRDAGEAREYLEEVADRVLPAAATIERHVETPPVGEVAQSIVEHAAEFGSDLIALCTHGRGALRHRLFGSVAQRVVASGQVPVLLVPPEPAGLTPLSELRHLLIPLDGTVEHEGGLKLAVAIARSVSARLHLVAVVPTLSSIGGPEAATGLLLPRTTAAVLDLARERVGAYLDEQVADLRARQLAVTAEIRRGDPTRSIVGAAETWGADVIVLATHGRTGTDAFWSGSVTPRVSAHARLPLLLVPAAREDVTAEPAGPE